MAAVESGLTVERLIKFDGEGTLKAFCDLAIGKAFLVKGLRVVHGKNGLFVSMPRQKGKDSNWYDIVATMTKEAKQGVEQVVLEAYKKE